MSYNVSTAKNCSYIRGIIELQENKQPTEKANTLENQLRKYNKARGVGVSNVCNNKGQD